MPKQIALFLCIALIIWLFYRDRKLRPMTSVALWIPLFSFIILGTRALSMWFSDQSLQIQNLDDYLEGNPFDRNISFCLIIAGLAIFIKRWSRCWGIAKENMLFFMFFAFCGISCFWSEYAFTAFKRYVKDFGNLVMACIVISEANPKQAIRAVLARYVYIAIPLSVLFIFYFPEFGRYYSRWTGAVGYSGITTEKNALGQIAFICGMFIIWDLIEILTKKDGVKDKFDLFTRYILFAMVLWLLYKASSSTATFCMIMGTIMLFVMQMSFFKNQIKNLGIWAIVLFLLVIIIYSLPGLFESFVKFLGRDATLTGRTDLWMELLTQSFNPLLGYGFQSFWQTPAAALIGEKYAFIPNQAHNGYLEVYIQTGFISLFLLISSIIVAGKQLKNGLLMGDALSKFFFPFYLLILISNWTEATINKMSILWFILIMILLYRPKTVTANLRNNETADASNIK